MLDVTRALAEQRLQPISFMLDDTDRRVDVFATRLPVRPDPRGGTVRTGWYHTVAEGAPPLAGERSLRDAGALPCEP